MEFDWNNGGPAASQGGEATFGSRDAASGSLIPTARALQMLQLCQRRTFLLDHLVTALEDWQADTWAWWEEGVAHQDRLWAEDITHEDKWDQREEAWDQANPEFQAQLLALKHEQENTLQEQNDIMTGQCKPWTMTTRSSNEAVCKQFTIQLANLHPSLSPIERKPLRVVVSS
ncbi:hypothetical protein Y1Q_0013491 [Alligator mississippiensis]|uniref:Uncharacterized protein n=1 Tax=Alligator mississippiensis TaxID=8496 RepID=A0A151P3U9_ALLMI|nr:hypothetical protein Y1Q_0013491 [Alligator mississippiensis]